MRSGAWPGLLFQQHNVKTDKLPGEKNGQLWGREEQGWTQNKNSRIAHWRRSGKKKKAVNARKMRGP